MSTVASRSIDSLTNDEIESCFDGCSNVDLVRSLLQDNLNIGGFVCTESFGEDFARAIEGFIDAEFNTEEWEESWAANRDWGESIGENVNELLTGA